MFLTQRIPRKKIQRSFEENNLIDGLASSRLPLSRIDHIINTHKLGHSYEGRILEKRKTRTRGVRSERSDESEHFEPRVKKYRVNDRDVKEASRTYLGEKAKDAKQTLPFQNLLLNNCKTVYELIRRAFDGRTDFGPSSLAAFWTLAAHLLKKDVGSYHAENDVRFGDKLNEIFIITRNTLADFGCDSIGELVIAMSKIAERCRKGSYYHHEMIYHALFGHRLESKGNILDNIVSAAVPNLVRYDFQGLANIAIGFARIGLNPILDDGSTLFDRIAIHAVTRFPSDPREWSIHFNPNLLSNTAWAFAKVNQSNRIMFKMIAEVSIQQMARFNSQDISITLWAFTHTGKQKTTNNKKLLKIFVFR
ncbi:hypothetical protein ACHAWX_003018, partial [Stephanocyclus meneghinianus]